MASGQYGPRTGVYTVGSIERFYIFRWKGRIAAGTTCDEPINSVDLYPTLLELAGAPAPDNYPLDGASYLGLLTGGPKPKRDALFWHFPGYLGAGGDTWRTTPVSVIRARDWKLLEFHSCSSRSTDRLRPHGRVLDSPKCLPSPPHLRVRSSSGPPFSYLSSTFTPMNDDLQS